MCFLRVCHVGRGSWPRTCTGAGRLRMEPATPRASHFLLSFGLLTEMGAQRLPQPWASVRSLVCIRELRLVQMQM